MATALSGSRGKYLYHFQKADRHEIMYMLHGLIDGRYIVDRIPSADEHEKFLITTLDIRACRLFS